MIGVYIGYVKKSNCKIFSLKDVEYILLNTKKTAILLALFLFETFIWFSSLDINYSLDENAVKESVYPQGIVSVSGYDVEGNSFVAKNGDPQMYIKFKSQTVSSVVIKLERPLETDAKIQIYYPISKGDSFEKNSSVFIAEKDLKQFVLPIESGKYSALRIDFDASFKLKDIYISKSSAKQNYIINKRIILQLLFLYIATGLVIFVQYIIHDENPSSKKIRKVLSRNLPFEKLTNVETLFLVICFSFYFFWSLVFLKIDYGPDELMRYDVPLFIFKNKALPFGGEPELINPYWGTSYGFSITLPYLLSTFFMRIISVFTSDPNALWVAARFTSVISGMGIAYYSICITKRITNSYTRWLFIIPMALTPQIVFISSYVNLDSFSLFTVVFLIYTWVRGTEKQWDVRSCIWLGFGLGLCLISYQFAYPFVLGSFIFYCLWHIDNRHNCTFKKFIFHGLIVLAVVFLISGWHFIRNAYLYNGDIFALNASKPYAEHYAIDALKPSLKQTYMVRGYSVYKMLKETNWLESTFKSLFYVLGYMSWFAPPIVYKCFTFAIVLGVFGSLYGILLKKLRPSHNHRLMIVCLIISSILVLGISIYYSWASDYQPQGRYIITILPLVYSIIAYGVYCLINLLRIKSCYIQKCIVHFVFSAFILLDITATFNCLSHVIY